MYASNSFVFLLIIHLRRISSVLIFLNHIPLNERTAKQKERNPGGLQFSMYLAINPVYLREIYFPQNFQPLSDSWPGWLIPAESFESGN